MSFFCTALCFNGYRGIFLLVVWLKLWQIVSIWSDSWWYKFISLISWIQDKVTLVASWWLNTVFAKSSLWDPNMSACWNNLLSTIPTTLIPKIIYSQVLWIIYHLDFLRLYVLLHHSRLQLFLRFKCKKVFLFLKSAKTLVNHAIHGRKKSELTVSTTWNIIIHILNFSYPG